MQQQEYRESVLNRYSPDPIEIVEYAVNEYDVYAFDSTQKEL